ncbi:ATP-binding cassette domain-containing protein [Vibrio sp. SS-MA-C1-2]|uniref:ABC transporter ATP-binding protein n=1 Tax=Vibrio sp. SS-MA-C1-2 TaxID=2908646 RepID=UPI001F3801DE|nr:oligopeptide/dipeptide ABC transporter ATP-binding protein [Vibrio sp. SS-MA-C1-2]UJF19758.1 ATP-binding cassette domain-containing protein [Vibrio sp. SS-MA-C1-2]
MSETEIKSSSPLLVVDGLEKQFVSGGGFLQPKRVVHAVDDVSLHVNVGETLGIVGESGCGKSTLGKTILNLHAATKGEICFEGRDLTKLNNKEMRDLRQKVQIVFQDPLESLNSRQTVYQILEEPFIIHNVGTTEERQQWIEQLLIKVGLNLAAKEKYPHEFSGGQRQRIGIARAIALKPKLLVCDEAVSALDVSVQSQILNLLLTLQQELSLAMIFIAHDLSVVKHMSDRIAVMYLGRIVETGTTEDIFHYPKHPYTEALLSAIPITHPKDRGRERIILQGDVPSPLNPPTGCHFHPRCRYATDKCRSESPTLLGLEQRSKERNDEPDHNRAKLDKQHNVACHYPLSSLCT